MDVRLSAEQEALRDSVVRVADRYGPTAVGQLEDEARLDGVESAVAAAGWRELRASDGGDQPLASGVEVAIVAEELGRRLVEAPFLGPTLAADLRRLAGAPAAEAAETIALTSGLGDLARVTDGSVPEGAVAVDARGATAALVLLPADEGWSLGEVPLAPGEPVLDLTRPTVPVERKDDAAAVAGQTRTLTDDDLARVTALGLVTACADLVGVMAGATTLARDYAVDRRQYGTAIGSFQAVQHLLADAHVATEGSRSAVVHAAWAVDALDPTDALAAAAVAKAYCARAARTVCETSIQVHGGIGNTWECLAHVYLRRALVSSDVLGGVGPSLDRVLAHRGIGGDRGLR